MDELFVQANLPFLSYTKGVSAIQSVKVVGKSVIGIRADRFYYEIFALLLKQAAG
jgi:hypothetical protein